MMSDLGLSSQESDYASHIQAVLNELRQMQQTPQLVTSSPLGSRRVLPPSSPLRTGREDFPSSGSSP
jgi:hypothetical protein